MSTSKKGGVVRIPLNGHLESFGLEVEIEESVGLIMKLAVKAWRRVPQTGRLKSFEVEVEEFIGLIMMLAVKA
jgi:hypothetical protein